MVAGLDEAGRGAVLGPLVVAGVCTDQEGIEALKELGVKDSKTLSADTRESLSPRIRELCKKVRIVRIPPERIDQYVLRRKRLMRLNLLEAETMASITKKLCPQVAYVDSCDVNALRYGRTISKLAGGGIRIRSFHKADVRFPIVSAASIIAKVARDREIIRLVHEYGDIGTGYPSDPKTIAFLKAWLRKEPSPPLCARHSWSTFERLSPTLGDFPTV